MRAELYESAASEFQRDDRFEMICCRPVRRVARVQMGKGEPMAITQTARVRSFDSTSPATGEVVGTFPADGPEQVAAAVDRAREAAAGWAGLGFEGRRRALQAYKALLVRRTDELVALVHRENGKPHADALIEVLLIAEHLDWAARNAAKVLGPRRARGTLLLANHAASVEYQPLGVVGVIGPWNYPVFTPLGSIVYALAAGNAVVFKPSELTPAVGCFLADTFAEAVPDQPVLQVVTGDGATGHALCLAGVDKIALTGSPATGRKVMAACAETLTPVVLELGGKDAMIVDADADLDAAAEQAVWGGMANAGQTCLAVERVYVVEAVYEPFLARLVEHAARIRPGAGPDADFGPITLPRQLEIIRRHLDDAFGRGARALVGGPDAVRPPYVDPVVLVDVPPDALVMREETFGPVLPVISARDADHAVTLANANPYGLGAAVFAGRRAEPIARALRSGMASINSVLTFAGMPSLPLGGVGESGFGRIHGPDGLREFSRSKSITRQRFPLPFPMLSFDRPGYVLPAVKGAMRLRHGRTQRS
jgi:succinate-semialdehyde dehydrogenase / glutarate-semialdehyde dehydrogenase